MKLIYTNPLEVNLKIKEVKMRIEETRYLLPATKNIDENRFGSVFFFLNPNQLFHKLLTYIYVSRPENIWGHISYLFDLFLS